ncbi:MAG: hypothetical protein M3Y32_14365 [Pseudomonadota bacterium]|nr:hypothetical protein [Pseudomonadota bacterium]
MASDEKSSFGVFKPVGHILISFPSAEQADGAMQALAHVGLPPDALRRWTDTEMLAQIDRDMQSASPLAAIGQELNLIKAHRELAAKGYHWLMVRGDDEALLKIVADAVQPFGAEQAQHYGRFIIEELIDPPSAQPQVAESPDRGLDSPAPAAQEP